MGFLGTGWRRVFILGAVAIVVVAIVFSFFGRSEDAEPDIPLSDVIDRARNGDVRVIEVRGDLLDVTLADGRKVDSRKERDTSIIDTLEGAGVQVGGEDGVVVDVRRDSGWGNWVGLLISFLPLLLFGGILVVFMRVAMRRRD